MSVKKGEKIVPGSFCVRCGIFSPPSAYIVTNGIGSGTFKRKLICVHCRREMAKSKSEVASARSAVASANKRSTRGTITDAAYLDKFAYYGWKCWYCGEPAKCIDHALPLAGGGLNIPANILPACMECNSRKGSRKRSIKDLRRIKAFLTHR